MACIDKTYTSDYQEYQRFLKWAKETTFECPNGLKIWVFNSVYPFWSEENMKESEKPVINSSYTLDYFLIKYCPFKFVQDRLKYVYGDTYYNSVKEGTSEYDTFKYPEIGTHFKIVRGPLFKSKNFLWKLRRRKILFDITVSYNDYPLWYNSKIKKFLLPNELGEGNMSWMYAGRTIKSLIRHLKNLKLPKYSIVRAQGRFVGEDLLILVK